MAQPAPCPRDLKLVGFDVDGVFTDGRFYLSDDGIESKAFFVQDGFGIRQLLEAGVEIVIISGRQSVAVERRMTERPLVDGQVGDVEQEPGVGPLADRREVVCGALLPEVLEDGKFLTRLGAGDTAANF